MYATNTEHGGRQTDMHMRAKYRERASASGRGRSAAPRHSLMDPLLAGRPTTKANGPTARRSDGGGQHACVLMEVEYGHMAAQEY